MYQAGGPRLRMRTSEPRDRAWWTLAASVPEADIDYSRPISITVRGRVAVATRTRTRRSGRVGRPRRLVGGLCISGRSARLSSWSDRLIQLLGQACHRSKAWARPMTPGAVRRGRASAVRINVRAGRRGPACEVAAYRAVITMTADHLSRGDAGVMRKTARCGTVDDDDGEPHPLPRQRQRVQRRGDPSGASRARPGGALAAEVILAARARNRTVQPRVQPARS